jgi:hypothetical protein
MARQLAHNRLIEQYLQTNRAHKPGDGFEGVAKGSWGFNALDAFELVIRHPLARCGQVVAVEVELLAIDERHPLLKDHRVPARPTLQPPHTLLSAQRHVQHVPLLNESHDDFDVAEEGGDEGSGAEDEEDAEEGGSIDELILIPLELKVRITAYTLEIAGAEADEHPEGIIHDAAVEALNEEAQEIANPEQVCIQVGNVLLKKRVGTLRWR